MGSGKSLVGERQAAYNRLCTFCACGEQPTKREIYKDHWMWIHDGVTACKASDLRIQHANTDAINAQKEEECESVKS